MSAQSFGTNDVDEANALARDVFYESHVEPVPNASTPFRFEMKFDTLGSMTIGILSHGCEIDARAGGLDMTYSVGVPLKGAFAINFGQEEVVADPTAAVVTTPTSQVRYRGYPTGTERLVVISFDRQQLHNHLRDYLGRDRIDTIKLAPSLDLGRGLGAQWWHLTSALALWGLESSDSLPTHPELKKSLSSAIMTGFLLASDHQYRDALDAWIQPAPSAIVRRAIDIIERHAAEPLSVVELAAEVGCGVRALQLSFRKQLDLTPAEYIRRVRLDRAHAMLQSSNPAHTSVPQIARLWGFNKTSRFVAQYRKAYGVTPDATLRKG